MLSDHSYLHRRTLFDQLAAAPGGSGYSANRRIGPAALCISSVMADFDKSDLAFAGLTLEAR
jgi:hypothetical protein